MLAIALAIVSAILPAGIPDRSAATRELRRAVELDARQHALRRQAAELAAQARAAFIAERYRRPPETARAIVRAAEQAGRRHGVEPTLLLAIVETESSFDVASRSGYGARGLMQVVPRHHPAEIAAIGGADRLHDIELGVEVGARILAAYLQRSGDLPTALRRYSGGASRYADKVLARQQAFERIGIYATRALDATAAAPVAVATPVPRSRG
ncbi:MAG: transglycosylase SLT domain-containing protein [Lautropia sp.]